MAYVHTEVLVGEYFITLSHDESAKGPVALTDRKFAAARIFYFRDRTNGDFNNGHSSYSGQLFRI